MYLVKAKVSCLLLKKVISFFNDKLKNDKEDSVMKKKNYVTPKLEYWRVRAEDVIMTSGESGEGSQPDFFTPNLELGGNEQWM